MSERHPTPAPPESCPNPYDHSARAPILVAKWDPLNCYGIAQAARLACPDSAVFECHSAITARTWLQQRTFALGIFGLTSRTRNNGVACTTGYDTTSQLRSANYGTGSPLAKAASPVSRETFAYDALGNRTSTSTVGGVPSPRVTSYTANALNQYTQVGGVAFAYDANGNLTNDGKQTYRYDAQNRLLAVEPIAPATGAVRAEFAYDNRNRAVARTYWTLGKAGAWVLNQDDSRALTYDTAWNLLAERTRNGAQVGEYIHGQRTDEVLRAELKTYNLPLTACYPMPDGLGSVVALANDSGKVAERFRYSAYGQPTSISPSYQAVASLVSNYRFLFTGPEWLAPVSLNEHRNRYYSASLARWLTTDPIYMTDDINIYAYAGNSSTNTRDGFGLCRDQGGFAACVADILVGEAISSIPGIGGGLSLALDLVGINVNVFQNAFANSSVFEIDASTPAIAGQATDAIKANIDTTFSVKGGATKLACYDTHADRLGSAARTARTELSVLSTWSRLLGPIGTALRIADISNSSNDCYNNYCR